MDRKELEVRKYNHILHLLESGGFKFFPFRIAVTEAADRPESHWLRFRFRLELRNTTKLSLSSICLSLICVAASSGLNTFFAYKVFEFLNDTAGNHLSPDGIFNLALTIGLTLGFGLRRTSFRAAVTFFTHMRNRRNLSVKDYLALSFRYQPKSLFIVYTFGAIGATIGVFGVTSQYKATGDFLSRELTTLNRQIDRTNERWDNEISLLTGNTLILQDAKKITVNSAGGKTATDVTDQIIGVNKYYSAKIDSLEGLKVTRELQNNKNEDTAFFGEMALLLGGLLFAIVFGSIFSLGIDVIHTAIIAAAFAEAFAVLYTSISLSDILSLYMVSAKAKVVKKRKEPVRAETRSEDDDLSISDKPTDSDQIDNNIYREEDGGLLDNGMESVSNQVSNQNGNLSNDKTPVSDAKPMSNTDIVMMYWKDPAIKKNLSLIEAQSGISRVTIRRILKENAPDYDPDSRNKRKPKPKPEVKEKTEDV